MAVVARPQRHKTCTPENGFVISLTLDTVLENSTPEEFAHICQIERDGIRAMNFKTAEIHFLRDVFATVVVVVVVDLVPHPHRAQKEKRTRENACCCQFFCLYKKRDRVNAMVRGKLCPKVNTDSSDM